MPLVDPAAANRSVAMPAQSIAPSTSTSPTYAMRRAIAWAHSMTGYDIPQAQPLPWTQAIGFFDDLFYRQLAKDENVVAPALNFFLLAGFLAWLVRPRHASSGRAGTALLIADQLPEGDPQKPVVDAYKTAFEEKTGTPVGTFGGYAHDAFMIMTDAITRADVSMTLARSLRRWGATGTIAVTSLSVADCERLEVGVAEGCIDLVLQPFDDAADDAIATLMGRLD